MKRGTIILSTLLLALLLPLASAGFFDKLLGRDVRESPQNFNVNVGNSPPAVIVQNIANPIIPPGLTGPVNIIFRASDNNGIATLVDGSIFIALDYSGGGESRTGNNSNCIPADIDGTTREYNCNIDMYYYDHDGTWTINITIQDTGGLQGENSSEIFIVPVLQDITFPLGTTIGFGNVFSGQENRTSSSPTILTNNGNYGLDEVSNFLYIESTPLIGETNQTYNIPATNFRAADSSEINSCATGTLLNGTPIQTPIPVLLPKGSLGNLFPTENITYCLTLVPPGLIDQIYSTAATGGIAWEITV